MVEKGFFQASNVVALVSFLTCLAILAVKTRFICRVLKANTDVNVLNHSIALVFAASGIKGMKTIVESFFQVSWASSAFQQLSG